MGVINKKYVCSIKKLRLVGVNPFFGYQNIVSIATIPVTVGQLDTACKPKLIVK